MDERTQILDDLSDALSRLLTTGLFDMQSEHQAQLAHLLQHDLTRVQLTIDLEPFRVLVTELRPGQPPRSLFRVEGKVT